MVRSAAIDNTSVARVPLHGILERATSATDAPGRAAVPLMVSCASMLLRIRLGDKWASGGGEAGEEGGGEGGGPEGGNGSKGGGAGGGGKGGGDKGDGDAGNGVGERAAVATEITDGGNSIDTRGMEKTIWTFVALAKSVCA